MSKTKDIYGDVRDPGYVRCARPQNGLESAFLYYFTGMSNGPHIDRTTR